MLRSFIVCLLLIFPSVCVAAEDRRVLRAPDVEVVFPAALEPLAREVLKAYPAARTELEATLRWTVRFRPVVVLIPDSETFRHISGSPHMMALAEPGRNLIAIDAVRVGSHPFTLEGTLEHELCHLLLHDRIPASSLPLWLNEGLAQWVSGGLSELVVQRREAVLDRAVISGRLIPLGALSRRFPHERGALLLAYEQSLSLVTFMIDRFGVEALLGLLNRLAAGEVVEEAFTESLSHTPASLEEEWRDTLKGHRAWTAVLIGHLYEILFSLAAVAMVAGFFRHLKRKRAAMEELEEAEEGGGE